MAHIKYVEGDVTEAESDRPVYIPHVCNDAGLWGAGFVLALSNKWDAPERDYRFSHDLDNLRLGKVIDSIAETGRVYVANMIAQSGTGFGRFQAEYAFPEENIEFTKPLSPIRYGALAKCMRHVAALARQVQAEIHAPRFGSGLAGGEWDVIESMILELWVDEGISVTIYDLPPKDS